MVSMNLVNMMLVCVLLLTEVPERKLNSKAKRKATFWFEEFLRKFPRHNLFFTRVVHTASATKPLHALTDLRLVSRNARNDKEA